MKRTVFFSRVSLLASLFGVASLVFSQSSPPASEKTDQTKALVNKAAALIESKGKAPFSEFRVKGSEWFHEDTYVFVYDRQANVLLNPAFPAREGTNVKGQKVGIASCVCRRAPAVLLIGGGGGQHAVVSACLASVSCVPTWGGELWHHS